MIVNITDIKERNSRDTVATLEDLMRRARLGQISGMAFAIKTGARSHRIGFTGHYLDDPLEALGCVTRMGYRLNQMAESDDESDTRSMPL